MSRMYDMSVSITEYESAKKDEIADAANDEWDFENWEEWSDTFTAGGEGSLCGGESEEGFTQRLTNAIWKANGKFCKVNVCATYLEEIPHEHHELDEDDYTSFVAEEERAKKKYKPTYWCHVGRFEKEYNILFDKMIPAKGKAKGVDAEALRLLCNFYKRRYNDGDYMGKFATHVNKYAKVKKRSLDIHITAKTTDQELDGYVDSLIEYLWGIYGNQQEKK